MEGTREEVEERALPFREGEEVLVHIVEPHMYNVDDAVAKIDGYIISVAGGGPAHRRARSASVRDRGGRAHRGDGRAAWTPTRAGGRRRRRRRARIEASAPWPQRRTAPFALPRPRPTLRSDHETMYAIVKTGGKQYRVEEGQTLLVERLPDDEGATVALEPLLFRSDDAVFDADGLAKVKVDGQGRRARARPEAARLQVQAQARLQEAHRATARSSRASR